MTFTAVLLVCAASMPNSACDEISALEATSTVVANELACAHGSQEAMARRALSDMVGVYMKSLCRKDRK